MQHARRTWLEIQCQFYAEAGGRVVVLVLGYDIDRYLEALGCTLTGRSGATKCGGCSLQLLENPSPELGPLSSLAQAGSWIESATDFPAAFYLPIDTPVPSATVLHALAQAMGDGICAVQPQFDNRGGHPVLLSRGYLRELTTLDTSSPDSRLDWQIRRQQAIGAALRVPVTDSRVLLNLNDSDSWERYFRSETRFEMAASPTTTPNFQ